ncbi:hypothetical protein [Paraburkholderia tropica]|uniref:hypothetical protein n=1 Tax=Paraburkholderia tropica TaxID=92647 RepID=UPI002AB0A72D|nr:hypothetical protein [Paraburkholderia tropica]
MANAKHELEISLYDGEFVGDVTLLTQICVIEGSVTPYDAESFPPLEETSRLLEMCAEKYATPPPNGDYFTVFISRKSIDDADFELLMRLDVYAHNGEATACVVSRRPEWNTERVRYQPDDSALTIVFNVLRSNVGGAPR